MQSKLLNCVVALAMLVATPGADAECWINADGAMSCSRSARPVSEAGRPIVRAATAPIRWVTSGGVSRQANGYECYGYTRFGRALYRPAVARQSSSGCTGSYGTYQTTTQSYGSSGGTATYEASSGSSGGLGSYGDGPTDNRSTAAPVTKAAPAASVPLGKSECKCGPDCDCGPDCQCQTQVCTIPAAAPSTRYCIVPPASVSATCRVPASGPSVEAVAAL